MDRGRRSLSRENRNRRNRSGARRLRRHGDIDESHVSFHGRDEDSFDDNEYDDEQMDLVDDESEPVRANKKLKQMEQNRSQLNGRKKDKNKIDLDILDE